MSLFVKKNVSLDQDPIGSYLKKIREKRGYNLEEIAEKLKINIKYLIAIENGDYQSLPKGIYGKIFFKKYIDFLELKQKNIVNEFIKEQNRSQKFESNLFFNRVVNWKNLLVFPRLLRASLIFLVIIICVFYLFFYFRNVFSPPFLEVYNLEENKIISSFDILVEGKTDPESEIKINDQLVLIDQDGFFSEKIYLRSGINFINISTKKKHSKERKIIKQVLVDSNKK